MSDYNFLLAIAGVLLIGAMSPGPTFMVIARNTLSRSRGHGLATALGTAFGVSLFAILASLGVTTLLEEVPNAFMVFKVLGGGYLLYLAWRIWRSAHDPLLASDAIDQKPASLFSAFLIGLVTQISNPKTALVIAGIFAAFVPVDPPRFTIWLVAGIAYIIDFSWYALVVLMLSGKASRNAYHNAKASFDYVAAIFLGGIGLKLIVS